MGSISNLKDKRHKYKIINIRSYVKKKFPVIFDLYKDFPDKEFKILLTTLPLETFILTQEYNSVKFYTNTTSTSNFLNISLNIKNYFYTILYLKFNLNKLFFPLDMTVFEDKKKLYFYNIFSCYYWKNFLNIKWVINKNFLTPSISNIYPSYNWVERELKESFNIYFVNLKDSRRLLTDYTNVSYDYITYNTISYDLSTQNLYLN